MNIPSSSSRVSPSLLLCCFSLSLGACGRAPETPGTGADAAGKLEVAVSVAPLAGLVRRIGGDRVVVHTFVQPGQDPHAFAATPKQIMALENTRAFVSIGMPFEKALVPKLRDSLPDLRIVESAAGIAQGHGEGAEAHEKHTEGEEHTGGEQRGSEKDGHAGHKASDGHEEAEDAHHEHDDSDLHIWLAPPLIRTLVHNIHDALVELDPDNAAEYDANIEAFLGELDEVDTSISKKLAPYAGQTFFVYHAAFGRFAEAYGLRQGAIETGGKDPTPKQLTALITEAKASRARVIFVQPQFNQASARTVADAIGGRVVPIDPLAEDVLENLVIIADAIEAAFSARQP